MEEVDDWEARREESVDVKAREVEEVISLDFDFDFALLWWGKREAFDAISSTLENRDSWDG